MNSSRLELRKFRERGVHSKSMLRAGTGDPSDPVERLVEDLTETPVEGFGPSRRCSRRCPDGLGIQAEPG